MLFFYAIKKKTSKLINAKNLLIQILEYMSFLWLLNLVFNIL